MNKIAKKMPEADDHAPLTVLNRRPRGIRTMTVCSCEWMPASAPVSSRTMHVAHDTHRRDLGLPPAAPGSDVFGEGPWMGLTWDEWYRENGGRGIDPFTGERDGF